MIQFLVTYSFLKKSDRDGFYAEIQENDIQRLSRAEAGCVRYDYYFPCEGELSLFLVEEWESIEQQQAHITQPHFALLGELKKKYNAATAIEKSQCAALE